MSERKNRITVEVYEPRDAIAMSSRDSHWVELRGEGGSELTIWCKTGDQAERIAEAINTP